jgi:hypothetical protein
VGESFCDGIATFRRWAQRIGNDRLIYLDETQLRLNEAERSTLALPGEPHYVVVEENSSYAARYDMIAVCTGKEVLPPIVYTPEDRKQLKVNGITAKMLIQYIQNLLAQSMGALDRYPLYLILDQSSIHNREAMLEAFHLNACQDLVDIKYMPSKSAKRLSPLDNGIFGWWKETCRKKGKIHKNNIQHVMISAWNSINSQLLTKCYKHCLLSLRQNPYDDCPLPQQHQHDNYT